MLVDIRLANVMAEAKRVELAKSYRAANRNKAEKRPLFGARAVTPRPLVRRLLPNR